MLKNWKNIALRLTLTLALIFVVIQFLGPVRTNPPVLPGGDLAATNPPPPEVMALLHTACYDCHSHETTWPWYAHVAPASWLVINDVIEGRQHLNFSEWPHGDPDLAVRKLDHISEALDDGDMPPAKYTLIHVNARLTPAQRQMLEDWADATAKKLRPAGEQN
jgi:hypothetical protein